MKYPAQKKMIDAHGGVILALSELPFEYQAAMAWYMAVDGEAWELPATVTGNMQHKPFKNKFVTAVPQIVGENSNEKFGMVSIPVKVLLAELIARNPHIKEERRGNVDDYHKWYMKSCGVEKHDITKPLWPVILGDDEDVIQDGWHRFNWYVHSGIEMIPCIYYPS